MTSNIDRRYDDWEAGAFELKLSRFDRIGFGLAMRAIEVRLVFDQPHHDDAAVEILRRFIADRTMQIATMESLCCECLPVRTANLLEDRGIHTMHDLAAQTYFDLLAIPNLSDRTIEQMRSVVDQVRAGKFVIGLDNSYDNLKPDWSVDVDDLQSVEATTTHKGATVTNATLKDALSVLMNAGPEAVAEIDREIDRVTAQLEELKRMRKMIAPSAKSPRGLQGNESLIELEINVFDLVKQHGPMKPKEIAEAIGKTNHFAIGKAVARSSRLIKRGAMVAAV